MDARPDRQAAASGETPTYKFAFNVFENRPTLGTCTLDAGPVTVSGSRRRVLLVDDHRPSLMVLRHAVTTRGNKVEMAESADNAITAIPTFRPDLVLYEWNLRGGVGLGLARQLRVAAGRSRMIIVSVSTMDEPDDFREREDVDGYLVKPFDGAALDRVLALRRGRRKR